MHGLYIFIVTHFFKMDTSLGYTVFNTCTCASLAFLVAYFSVTFWNISEMDLNAFKSFNCTNIIDMIT